MASSAPFLNLPLLEMASKASWAAIDAVVEAVLEAMERRVLVVATNGRIEEWDRDGGIGGKAADAFGVDKGEEEIGVPVRVAGRKPKAVRDVRVLAQSSLARSESDHNATLPTAVRIMPSGITHTLYELPCTSCVSTGYPVRVA